MIKLLRQIFADNELFTIRSLNEIIPGISDNFIAEYKDQKKKEYFIVLITDNLSQMVTASESSQIEVIYNELVKQEHYKSDFNKNTSLIILYKTGDTITEKLKRQFYQIEEDPYFFKKHVIYYTDKELNDLNTNLPKITIENLDNSVNNLDFEAFKNNPFAQDYKRLLLTLYVKIPFLKTPHRKREVKNLTDKIIDQISKSSDYDDLVVLRERLLTDKDFTDPYTLFRVPKNK